MNGRSDGLVAQFSYGIEHEWRDVGLLLGAFGAKKAEFLLEPRGFFERFGAIGAHIEVWHGSDLVKHEAFKPGEHGRGEFVCRVHNGERGEQILKECTDGVVFGADVADGFEGGTRTGVGRHIGDDLRELLDADGGSETPHVLRRSLRKLDLVDIHEFQAVGIGGRGMNASRISREDLVFVRDPVDDGIGVFDA